MLVLIRYVFLFYFKVSAMNYKFALKYYLFKVYIIPVIITIRKQYQHITITTITNNSTLVLQQKQITTNCFVMGSYSCTILEHTLKYITKPLNVHNIN